MPMPNYDKLCRVIRADYQDKSYEEDEHWVASEYDVIGNRLQVNSSFGANILYKRDKMGQVTHMVAYLDKEKPWAAKMAYNATGQEVLRQVSGGVVNSFSYDEVGRPVSHKISGEKERLHRHRRMNGM